MSHPSSSHSASPSSRRPALMSELAEKARTNNWDENGSLKYFLRLAEKERRDGAAYFEKRDLESSFVSFARAASLHPQSDTFWPHLSHSIRMCGSKEWCSAYVRSGRYSITARIGIVRWRSARRQWAIAVFCQGDPLPIHTLSLATHFAENYNIILATFASSLRHLIWTGLFQGTLLAFFISLDLRITFKQTLDIFQCNFSRANHLKAWLLATQT